MKHKGKYKAKKMRKNIIEYIATNRLFILYAILSVLGLMLIRSFTIGNFFNFKAFLSDLALVLMIGSFGYLVKPKNRFRYFFIILIIFTVMELVNSIYYKFYFSFASFGELATVSQTKTVAGSIFERLNYTDIIYLIFPIIFYLSHKHIAKTAYYNLISVVEKRKKMFASTLLVGLVFLGITFATATKSDFSKLAKRWNRVSTVERFGLVMYQCNDLAQSLTPKINSLFGYEQSAQKFTKYFTSSEANKYKEENDFTNILKGYNIVFIHMEGIETYLMDIKFNGIETTPNLNKIAQEGMFFSKFYPQISTGTSSDTEFTLLTSLLPAASGTVFTSYYDRSYITLPKLLKEEGYSTFSMHGNHRTMWNRDNVHPNLGYDDMFFEEYFKYDEDDIINLGINDKLFFKQAIPIIEKYEKEHNNYMGTVITLSNHSPFLYLDKYGEYDMSSTFKDCDEKNHCVIKTTDYLKDKDVYNYITSSHYADAALGDLFKYINESDYFNNTLFVLYGDHDVKLPRSEIEYLYNYDYKTGELKDEDDPTYRQYDYYDHELNKNTPLIFWTKNRELKNIFSGEVDYVMGMYDVFPTLANMLGIKNDYMLGHDIFNTKYDNVVVFPNGNFTTNLIYYNNSTGQSKIIKDGAEISSDYINDLIEKTENILDVSNGIIVHNLIENEGKKVKAMKENGD